MPNSDPVLLKGTNLAGLEDWLRVSFHALKVLDIEHERIHAGRMFGHTEVHTLTSGASMVHLIMPTNGSALHLRQVNFDADGGPGVLKLFEAPFIDTNSLGTLTTSDWHNMNRSSANVLPAAVYENPFFNISSAGTELFGRTLNSAGAGPAQYGKEVGVTREWMLNSQKNYAIYYLNENAGIVVGDASFLVYDAVEG